MPKSFHIKFVLNITTTVRYIIHGSNSDALFYSSAPKSDEVFYSYEPNSKKTNIIFGPHSYAAVFLSLPYRRKLQNANMLMWSRNTRIVMCNGSLYVFERKSYEFTVNDLRFVLVKIQTRCLNDDFHAYERKPLPWLPVSLFAKLSSENNCTT